MAQVRSLVVEECENQFLIQKWEEGEKVASDEEIMRMIVEIENLRQQIRNLKSKVRRRVKKLGEAFTPLERARIEYEIELLKGEIRRYEIVEMKVSLPLIRAIGSPSGRRLEDKVDWNKAGKA